VRKGGFEPPRLSAPPPQDGVSASSTTSAVLIDDLAIPVGEGFTDAPDFATTAALYVGLRKGERRIAIFMLSCPAAYCNVKGTVAAAKVEIAWLHARDEVPRVCRMTSLKF
jgi:hypothetical protein